MKRSAPVTTHEDEMTNKERRMLYSASQALLRIPTPRDDRVKGAIDYSKEVREALRIFNSFVDSMSFSDDPKTTEHLLEQLVDFSERMGTK
jgi:hypothetical protein